MKQYKVQGSQGYPRHFAVASLKPATVATPGRHGAALSTAFRRGLIEAIRPRRRRWHIWPCYPRHFAVASLKQTEFNTLYSGIPGLSTAFRRGLIEATASRVTPLPTTGYPRHFAVASLKLKVDWVGLLPCGGYPRHFAVASLKRRRAGDRHPARDVIHGISPWPH